MRTGPNRARVGLQVQAVVSDSRVQGATNTNQHGTGYYSMRYLEFSKVVAPVEIGVATGVFWKRNLFFWGSNVEEILKYRKSRSREEKEAASELDASERLGIKVSFESMNYLHGDNGVEMNN